MNDHTNAKLGVATYECCNNHREITDLNVLFEAFLHARTNSDWKPQVQIFEHELLSELVGISGDVENRCYKFSRQRPFIMNERGKIRYITGDHIRDRVVKRALCHEVLIPAVRPRLIHDNGASLTKKGIDFSRKRFKTHLRRFYLSNGRSNEGYIWLGDYSKFFDNLQHDRLRQIFSEVVSDSTSLYLIDLILNESRYDVSYMSNEEYANSMDTVLNSVAWSEIPKHLKTGKKWLHKGVRIGDEVAQVAGIYYPAEVDNYIKIVEGVQFYGRYMDDMYIIHKDKKYLTQLSSRIAEKAKTIGLTLNERKTKIVPLSSYFQFLQMRYSVTESGRIVQKINPARLLAMRRKLRKLALILTEDEFDKYYRAWFNNYKKNMSRMQRANMDNCISLIKEKVYDKYNVAEWTALARFGYEREQLCKQRRN